jgi:hypothetical protein
MIAVTFRRARVLVSLLALMSIPGVAVAQSPGSEGGAPDPVLAGVELMNKVPVGVMATCVPFAPTFAGQLAVAQCTVGADTVVYASFEDLPSLTAAYEEITASVTIEGNARSCAEGPFEGTYDTRDGSEGGAVVCQRGDPALLLAWTDAANDVLGVLALADGLDYSVLHEQWLRVRLDAPAIAAASPSATRKPGFGAAPAATTAPVASVDEVVQWATAAVASSQYGSQEWSAGQATGEPDTPFYGDFATAWAPAASDAGPEWIELSYAQAVVPTRVDIHETSAAGFVTRVEAWDEGTGGLVVLWEGTDPSPDERTVFSPPLDAVAFATDRIRITIDTSVPGWNEIDAVGLIGTPA